MPGLRKHPDPLVQLVLNTDPEPMITLDAVRGLPKLCAKGRAILLLLEVSWGQRSLDAHSEQLDRAHRQPSHIDLHLLFMFCWWRALAFTEPDRPRMRALRDQMKASLSDQTPLELVAWFHYIDSAMCLLDGDALGSLEAVRTAHGIVPRSSPHYRQLTTLCAASCLQLGRGPVIEMPAPAPPGARWDARLRAALVADAVERGALEEVDERDFLLPPGPTRAKLLANVRFTQQLWRLMMEACAAVPQWHVPAEMEDAAWVRSTRALLRRDTGQALRYARIHAREGAGFPFRRIMGFEAYALIRAELAAGRGQAAHRLLRQRQRKGNCHYIDDFFAARVALLAKDRPLAATYLQRVLRAADHHKAHGRLDMEARLACELSPSTMLALSQQAVELDAPNETSHMAAPKAARPQDSRGIARLVFSSDRMRRLCAHIAQFAPHDLPVLVTGETGTGKELIARALHESSPRAGEPFVAVNCGALCDSLVESELFGHQRGAFTGADVAYQGLFREAGRGTILLDEIGDISAKLQRALLRVLESGEARPVGSAQRYRVHCRVVAATHADLAQRVERGLFRQDLLFRLRRLELHAPALRDRPQDVPTLAAHFVNLDRAGGELARLSPGLLERMQMHGWPGNVRELRNVIERMRVLHSDKLYYDLEDLDGASEALAANEPLPAPQPERERSAGSAPLLAEEGAVAKYLACAPDPRRRRERLRELFQRFETLKTKEITDILGVSRATATRDLQRLCAEGLIERVKPTNSPRTFCYRLAAHHDRSQ